MRTRRQAKLQSSTISNVSPMKKKEARGVSKSKQKAKKEAKPTKKVKKQKSRSPSPTPEKKSRRGAAKKKQQRVEQKSKPKQKAKQKQQSKQKDSHEKQKQKPSRRPQAKKDDEEKKDKQKPKSSSPQKAKTDKKDGGPAKDQIKKVLVKGAAPVDEYFDKGKDFHVLVFEGKVYTATLNQSNVSQNNNKYYNLQIIQSDKDPNINYFMTRWGRVGTPGQKSIQGPYNIGLALKMYKQKYNEKYNNGDYRQLQLNFGDDEQEQKEEDKKGGGNESQTQNQNKLVDYQESKLPKPLKDLINLIFDLGMMNKQMKQIGYNVNKMPLGKLSKDNIKKGYNILKQLYDQLQHKNRENVIQELTNDFYSYIPHDVGFKSMRMFKLDSLKKVKEKLEMLESLSEIKVATEILSKKEDGNQIENNYKKLNRVIEPVEKDSFTYKLINDYLQTTHGTTHRSYDLELIDLFEMHSEMEKNRFTNDIPNKMLLWHGSRLTNFVGILSQGLRIAPPQAPVTGYMFGKGVYFADMSSKSANYCFTNPDNNTGLLLLCEVALGNCNQFMHADYNASNLPDGKHSTKGVGRTAPQQQNFQSLDGMIIPMGPGKQAKVVGCSLQYNEYIVYSINQIKIRYLLRVKFHYKTW